MAAYKNTTSILPFYGSVSRQHYLKSYAYGKRMPIYTFGRFLSPFQIVVENNIASPQISVFVVRVSDGLTQDITTDINAKGFRHLALTDYDLLIWDAQTELANIVEGGGSWFKLGYYYLVINYDTQSFYSENFCISEDDGDFVKVSYWHGTEIELPSGAINYDNSFKNFCYLKTQIGKPSYPIEKIGDERNGYRFIHYQISKKLFLFEFFSFEEMLDAMRIISLHDHIEIEAKGITYDVNEFNLNPEWLEQGDIAKVECEFSTDTVVTATNSITTIN